MSRAWDGLAAVLEGLSLVSRARHTDTLHAWLGFSPKTPCIPNWALCIHTAAYNNTSCSAPEPLCRRGICAGHSRPPEWVHKSLGWHYRYSLCIASGWRRHVTSATLSTLGSFVGSTQKNWCQACLGGAPSQLEARPGPGKTAPARAQRRRSCRHPACSPLR